MEAHKRDVFQSRMIAERFGNCWMALACELIICENEEIQKGPEPWTVLYDVSK